MITLTALLEFPQRLFVVFRPNTNPQCSNKCSPDLAPVLIASLTLYHFPIHTFKVSAPFLTWLNPKSFTPFTFLFCELSLLLAFQTSAIAHIPPSLHLLVHLLHWTWASLWAWVRSLCLLPLPPSLELRKRGNSISIHWSEYVHILIFKF